jgi:phosphatidylglycerophosphatase A
MNRAAGINRSASSASAVSLPFGGLGRVIGTWFGCGLVPKGPGTAGSLGALVVAWPLHAYLGVPAWSFAVIAIVALWPAIWASGVVARQESKKDPQIVVVDEVVGQWLTLAGAVTLNWKSWLAALALFRLFDIWKPWPIRKLEALPGGSGIVMDDVMAGVYGALVLWAAGWFNLY